MICKKCGTKLPEQAHFCFNCGITVDEAVNTDNESVTEVEVKDEKIENVPEDNIKVSETHEPIQEVQEVHEVHEVQEIQEDVVPQSDNSVEEIVVKADNTEDESSEESSEEDPEINANKGFKIMVNPDYVPPVVEEEKPLFVEHVNYQEMHRLRAEKAERIATKIGTVILVIALLGAGGFVGVKIYFAHEFKTTLADGDSLFDAKNYDQAVVKYQEALDIYGADKSEVAKKIIAAYEDKGDYKAASKAAIDIYNQISDDGDDPDADLFAEYKRLLALSSDDADADSTTDKKDDATVDTDDKTADDDTDAKYQEVISQMSTSIAASDYDAVIGKYEEAVAIDPSSDKAYVLTAQAYAGKNDYENAAATVQKGIEALNNAGAAQSTELNDAKTQYQEALDKLAQDVTVYKNLMTAFDDALTKNMADAAVTAILSDDFDKICTSLEVTYYTEESGIVDSIATGKGMAIYANKYAYYGDWADGKRVGNGMLITAQKGTDNIITYYTYKGAWANDLPEGNGSITQVNGYGIEKCTRTLTVGTFKAGLEDGSMTLSKTEEGTAWGKMEYTVENGVPKALVKNGKEVVNQEGKKIMGYYYLNDKATHTVSFDEGTVFSVNGLS